VKPLLVGGKMCILKLNGYPKNLNDNEKKVDGPPGGPVDNDMKIGCLEEEPRQSGQVKHQNKLVGDGLVFGNDV